MPKRPPWPAATFASPLLALALQGCATPMTIESTAGDAGPENGRSTYNRLLDGPLRIRGHNIGAYCFSTWGCRVAYGRHLIEDQAPDRWQRPLPDFPGLRERMNGSMLAYRAFEGPVRIEWRDAQKQPLQMELDLAAIFPDRLIRHDVPDELIDPETTVGPPDIIIEVNDRTVRLYMRAHIPLKAPRIPGNPSSNFIDESVLVLERTL